MPPHDDRFKLQRAIKAAAELQLFYDQLRAETNPKHRSRAARRDNSPAARTVCTSKWTLGISVTICVLLIATALQHNSSFATRKHPGTAYFSKFDWQKAEHDHLIGPQPGPDSETDECLCTEPYQGEASEAQKPNCKIKQLSKFWNIISL